VIFCRESERCSITVKFDNHKTMLFLVDGLCENANADGPPHRNWETAPFNDAWPNSIFMSFDGVAIDSSGLDFLTSEWPDLPDSRTPITCANLRWQRSVLKNNLRS